MKTAQLHGYCEYCKETNCEESVHYEDSPKFYPFCEKHKKMNAGYHAMKKERKRCEDLYGKIK